MATERRVSAGKFVQSGLLNDADVRFTEVSWVRTDYDGNLDEEVTALQIVMVDKNDEKGDPHTSYLSIGTKASESIKPSKDGKYLVATGDKTTLPKNSNYNVFWLSLENCYGKELPENVQDEDIGLLAGLEGHLVRIAEPKREGLKREKKEGDFEKTIPTMTDVKVWPWEKGGKKSAGRKSKASSSKSEDSNSNSSSNNGDASTTAMKAIKAAILKEDGEIAFDDLNLVVYRTLKADKEMSKEFRQEVMDMVNDQKFVAEIDGVTVTKGIVSLEE